MRRYIIYIFRETLRALKWYYHGEFNGWDMQCIWQNQPLDKKLLLANLKQSSHLELIDMGGRKPLILKKLLTWVGGNILY